jgi:hypothetical protein
MGLYRVYQWQWVTVYPSQGTGSNGLEECGRVLAEKYAGRVGEDDARIEEREDGGYALQLFRPNLQGEFTASEAAEELRSGRGDGAVLAGQGSAEEQNLLDYSRRMQPGGGDRANAD